MIKENVDLEAGISESKDLLLFHQIIANDLELFLSGSNILKIKNILNISLVLCYNILAFYQ